MQAQILLNPFSKLSEKTLAVTGIMATIAGSFIGGYLDIVYDGFMDVHSADSNFLQSLMENLINVLVVSLLLFILARLINRKTRFIDLLNTAMLARIPTYIAAAISANPVLDNFAKRMMENPGDVSKIYGDTTELTIVLVISFLLIALFIWSIVLLVAGFRTAAHVKKPLHWILFSAALILAEIISKFIIYNFYA